MYFNTCNASKANIKEMEIGVSEYGSTFYLTVIFFGNRSF